MVFLSSLLLSNRSSHAFDAHLRSVGCWLAAGRVGERKRRASLAAVVLAASTSVLGTGCGVGEAYEIELPAGAYPVWEEPLPSQAVIDNSQDSEKLSSVGNAGPFGSSLQSPEIQSYFSLADLSSVAGTSPADQYLCTQESSFCGGELDGDWIVDDSCDARKNDPLQLWSLAQELISLSGAVCARTPRWLLTTWTGELTFNTNIALDTREEQSTMRVVVGPECLTSTLDSWIDESLRSTRTVQTTAENCALLNNEFTTCEAEPGRCVCITNSFRSGQGSGLYRYVDDQETVEIANPNERETIPYHYCVEDDERMVWWEPDTGDRVVLRRKGSKQRGFDLPTELPIVRRTP